MSVFSCRTGMILCLCGVSAAVGACAPLRGHQGYIQDTDLVASVQPGVDNQQSVQQVLGKPTFIGQFNDREWYYLSRDTRYYGYSKPRPTAQTVLRIRFNDKGVVSAVDKTGLEQVASVNPYGKTTPTLGRKHSFFEDLFGNIGQVGALGGGAGGPGGGDGGGDGP